MDRPANDVGRHFGAVHRLPEDVVDVAERSGADRNADRRAGIDHGRAAGHSVGGLHADRLHRRVADVLHDLGGDRVGLLCDRALERQREADLR